MPSPSANSSWFTITTALGEFAVYAFSGQEEICLPYEFCIELVSQSANEDLTGLLNTAACLTLTDKSGGTRHIHGLIHHMVQLHSTRYRTHYQCFLVPRLWFLDKKRDHRIFQHKSVVEIIQIILQEHGFTGEASDFRLFFKYEPREYCVQYAETDLHFITRLCEEEGIFFYFTHTENSHCVCFCDCEGGPRIPGESEIRYFQGSGQAASTAVISKVTVNQSVSSNIASYREWNFQKPKLSLERSSSEERKRIAPVPDGMGLENYRYPHLYQLQKSGDRYAKLQLARQTTFSRTIECVSDVMRFLPSFTFSIDEHPRDDVKASWWVTAIKHTGEQPTVLEEEAPDDRVFRYECIVSAIPATTRYIPPLDHPKHRIDDEQTAIVTGPAGEEIYTDEYGRVKVHFHWDRQGDFNENSSCWLRVTQDWAGPGYGSLVIPRIGHEVVVSFFEGDPDRPVVTGKVYHRLNEVPYPLPTNKTRSVFKSESTPGRNGERRGFNEIRYEDQKGAEEIYIHAEKNANAHIKNDVTELVRRDRHQTMNNFACTKIGAETHESFDGHRRTELFANDNLTVHGSKHIKADASIHKKADDEIHLEAGIKIRMAADSLLILKAGGSWLRFGGGQITGHGARVDLNGSVPAGQGTPAAPELPEEPSQPEIPPNPSANCLLRAASSGASFCSAEA
jgi:type VI secretion system secreted protein VgrG